MRCYAELERFLAGGRDPESRPVKGPRATRIQKRGDGIAVRYHETDVVTFYEDGSLALNSGGWRTVTTKARINEYLPQGWVLYQERGEWYLQRLPWEGGETYLFQDGMTLEPGCRVSGAGDLSGVKGRAKLGKAINTYARAYAKALLSGEIPAPSGGDCWGCAFKAEGPERNGGFMGTDHLESHLDEGYHVPSLLLRALEEFDGLLSPLARGVVHELWYAGAEPSDIGWGLDITEEQVRGLIRRYLRHSFDLAS